MEEVWKDIEGYENYQVSNLGRVKSLNYKRSGKEGILIPSNNSYGYLFVSLSKKSRVKKCRVHRLVANAFLPNPDNLPQVNHKDENPLNNHVDNLEWCTASYNLTYNDGNKRRAKKQSKTVHQYSLDGDFIKEWSSVMEAWRQTGISHISECCNNKRKTANGYIWRFV